MSWMRVWSPAGEVRGCTGCSTAMADGLLPLVVAAVFGAAGEHLGDVVPALLHADQAEAEVGDDVPYQVVRLLALGGQQQDVSGAGQSGALVLGLHPARVELVADRAGAVGVRVAVGDLDRERGRGLGEVGRGAGAQELAAVD